MRVVVFGAGAMGSFFGGVLSLRHEVTLVGRAEHVRALRAHGLRITGKTSLIAHPAAATRLPHGAKADLVLVSTKAYDTAGAMPQLRAVAKSAIFVTLQNGLDNADVISRTAPRVIAGTTSHGVTFVGPGVVRHAGIGDTVVGAWSGVTAHDVTHVRDIFADAGIRTRTTDDVRSELWAKTVVNAAINPLTALAGVPNGALVKDRRLAALVEGVCREAAGIAQADGGKLDLADVLRRTILVARRTAANRSSMLQDLDRHRRTEIDAITGAILRAAERHGRDAPMNRALHALVRAREAVLLEGTSP